MEILTRQQQRTYDLMAKKSGNVVSRDEIAQAIWGDKWLQKYSDWRIDRLIYLLRKKIDSRLSIKTVRNLGYLLDGTGSKIEADKPLNIAGTLPTANYLEYMNNPKNPRQVIANLFASLKKHPKAAKILVINSYSFDNVDALSSKYPDSVVFFSNFDTRAISLHQNRIDELNLTNFHSTYDDIRNSVLSSEQFDLIINDFRLNFNTNNYQNIKAVTNMHKLLKPGGTILVSVVVDPRYESKKFGENQNKAPTNKDKPWHFQNDEGLERKCFTVPYYIRLFKAVGFREITEFDTEKGKVWNPPFRRYKLTK